MVVVLHQDRLLHHYVLLWVKLLILIDHLDIDCLWHAQSVVEVLQDGSLRHTFRCHQVRREGLVLLVLKQCRVERMRHGHVPIRLAHFVLRHLLMVAFYSELMRIHLVLEALVVACLVVGAARLLLVWELYGSVEDAGVEQGVERSGMAALAWRLAQETRAYVHRLELIRQIWILYVGSVVWHCILHIYDSASEQLIPFGTHLGTQEHLVQSLGVDLPVVAAGLVQRQLRRLTELDGLLLRDPVLLLKRHHLRLCTDHWI